MSQLGASNHVKVSGVTMAKAVVRRIVRVILWTLLALFVVYVLFAATLWRVVPSTSGTGAVIVTTITAEGGHILPDTDILVSTGEESDSSIMNNLAEAFMPSDERFIGTVVAGPYGDFEARPVGDDDTDDDNEAEEDVDEADREVAELSTGGTYELYFEEEDLDLNVSGHQITERDDYERGMFLNDEYIVECVTGDCEPGDAVIVPQEYIMGEVLPSEEVTDALFGDRESGFVSGDSTEGSYQSPSSSPENNDADTENTDDNGDAEAETDGESDN